MDVRYKKFSGRRSFGIEIEVSSSFSKPLISKIITSVSKKEVVISRFCKSSNKTAWNIKPDASCGTEITSYIANTNDIPDILDVVRTLQDTGVKVTDNCGFHIHVEVKNLNVKQISSIVAHWMKIEDIFLETVPVRRRENMYCKSWKKVDPELFGPVGQFLYRTKLFNGSEFWDFIKPESPYTIQCQKRRTTLNIVNYAAYIDGIFYRPTLELRLPESTLNADDVECWIIMFINFINNCKNKEMPKDLTTCNINEFFEVLGLKGGADEILSPKLTKVKFWLLDRILQYTYSFNLFKNVIELYNRLVFPYFSVRKVKNEFSHTMVKNI